VYRANLNPPVLNAEHGNAASLDHAGRGRPNRKAGTQEQHWDDRRSQGRQVICRICPRRSGLEWREKSVEPLQLGIAIDERHLSLGAPKAVAQWITATKAANPVLPSYPRGIRCVLVMRRSPSGSGSIARKGLALERFEPCEAKVSRTVLRGAWAG